MVQLPLKIRQFLLLQKWLEIPQVSWKIWLELRSMFVNRVVGTLIWTANWFFFFCLIKLLDIALLIQGSHFRREQTPPSARCNKCSLTAEPEQTANIYNTKSMEEMEMVDLRKRPGRAQCDFPLGERMNSMGFLTTSLYAEVCPAINPVPHNSLPRMITC